MPLADLGASIMHNAECGGDMEIVFTRPPMGFVRQDVHYRSPVDGREITTYQEHINDLARHDCVPYEPGIKQDQERNEKAREAALEAAVDETVEREVSKMPPRKLEKLTEELLAGASAEPVRGTAPRKPVVTEIAR